MLKDNTKKHLLKFKGEDGPYFYRAKFEGQETNFYGAGLGKADFEYADLGTVDEFGALERCLLESGLLALELCNIETGAVALELCFLEVGLIALELCLLHSQSRIAASEGARLASTNASN